MLRGMPVATVVPEIVLAASTETMTLVQADSILRWAILTLKQRKERHELNGEMISLSGNETVPMWAITARTVGRVKENNDDDKRTRKERSKNYRSKTRSESSMNMWFSLPRVVCLVFSLRCLSSSFSTHDPCPSLVITCPLHRSN